MFEWISRILAIVVIGGIMFIVGTCAWQNCRKPDTGPMLPPIEKAQYSVTIKATGRTIYTNEIFASDGQYLLKGYWEVGKGTYVYHDIVLSLDKKVFGEIEVKRR